MVVDGCCTDYFLILSIKNVNNAVAIVIKPKSRMKFFGFDPWSKLPSIEK